MMKIYGPLMRHLYFFLLACYKLLIYTAMFVMYKVSFSSNVFHELLEVLTLTLIGIRNVFLLVKTEKFN